MGGLTRAGCGESSGRCGLGPGRRRCGSPNPTRVPCRRANRRAPARSRDAASGLRARGRGHRSAVRQAPTGRVVTAADVLVGETFLLASSCSRSTCGSGGWRPYAPARLSWTVTCQVPRRSARSAAGSPSSMRNCRGIFLDHGDWSIAADEDSSTAPDYTHGGMGEAIPAPYRGGPQSGLAAPIERASATNTPIPARTGTATARDVLANVRLRVTPLGAGAGRG